MNRATYFFPEVAKALYGDPISELEYASTEYIMAYSLGTYPSHQTYSIVDTGSDLIWLQCHPCYECYALKYPIIDVSSSLTYRNYYCNSDQCKLAKASVSNTYCDVVFNCQFRISYLDGSITEGTIAHDTLTLASTRGGKVAFPKTLFGCVHKTVGHFVPESSGVVGMGRGPISLISQMGSLIQGKFSYCLTPMFSEKTSKLHFGQSAVVSGPGTVSTPLGTKDNFYRVTLEAISVGDKRIQFNLDGLPNDEGNTVIDSGTRLTILPEDLYFEVESEVKVNIKADRTGDSGINQAFKLCYVSESIETLGAPIITLHFRDANVKLNPINTFVVFTSNVICFGVRPLRRISMMGNMAQVNFMVGFDLHNNIVSFKPTDCTML
ncbi:aspartic proteinase CDR1-like [Prosopis cineraria]|uniref:aspartic proteinase CDR1-like n=1 Tax=Prosopis cineraria TaxID=364024 RepID=UPI00240EA828|nr:aspartic proteinase CDR1-like [Prosopis cineraria]